VGTDKVENPDSMRHWGDQTVNIVEPDVTENPDSAPPDLCNNCGEPLTEEWPDRHQNTGLRRCAGLTTRHGDVYASRGYPKVDTATERQRKRNIARAAARAKGEADD
jgi:hypothetical protein